MTPSDFDELATWRYEPPYDFYNGDQEEPLNPERYFAARDDDDAMVGFYYYEPNGDVLDYGLGLRPDLTGADTAPTSSTPGSSSGASATGSG